MGIRYRLRQLRANVSAGPLTDEARAEVSLWLSDPEQALFFRYAYADQWHCLRVLHTLQRAGYNHSDLMAAALLHDIGKVRSPLSIWDRTVIVVGSALFPERAGFWGTGELESWRRPFVARAKHPEWGAEMAEEVGSRPVVIDLIRHHQDTLDGMQSESAQLLATLQWADDQN